MYCRECGNGIKAHAEICPNCGVRPLNSTNFCQSCAAPTNANQELCVKCGAGLKTAGNRVVPAGEDRPSGLLNITVCCFPIVGIILYFIWKNEKPKSARAACTWAIVGTSIGVLLYIIAFVIGAIGETMYYY